MLNRTFFITILSFALPAVALAADTSGLGFVPLTSIPGIADAGNASTLPSFLNNVYKLAIGVAAVLAVLQIVRAGIMYMGGDSVTEKKDAKNLITLSIGGLILVLSPVIVFSVINPKILSLEIGGLNDLTTTKFGNATNSGNTAGSGNGNTGGGSSGASIPNWTKVVSTLNGSGEAVLDIDALDQAGEQCNIDTSGEVELITQCYNEETKQRRYVYIKDALPELWTAYGTKASTQDFANYCAKTGEVVIGVCKGVDYAKCPIFPSGDTNIGTITNNQPTYEHGSFCCEHQGCTLPVVIPSGGGFIDMTPICRCK
jgi:type IV secretory pathway VirB2 component (pilin)